MLGDRAWRWDRARAKAAEAAPAGTLADYYAAPPPEWDGPATTADMIALDFETDGLEKQAAILQAGSVCHDLSGIDAGTAQSLLLRPDGALDAHAVTIHQLTDDQLQDCMSEGDALAELLPRLAGRVIVAHAAHIEAAFLDAACRRVFAAPFVAPFICTMQLEQRWFPRERAADGLRLGKLRASYGLPPYAAHDGLTDALAAAELLMAQWARRDAPRLKLAELLMR